jgi:PAS domain S-box-containing protein
MATRRILIVGDDHPVGDRQAADEHGAVGDARAAGDDRPLGVGDTAALGLDARLRGLGYDVLRAASTDAEEIASIARSAPAAHAAVVRATPAGEAAAAALRARRTVPAAPQALRSRLGVPVLFLGSEKDEARVRAGGLDEPDDFLVTPFTDRELRVHLELGLCRSAAMRVGHELEGFFAVSIDLFCFLDFNGYFRRLNQAWERTLGFTRQELMSRPFIEFVHPDDRERTLSQNASVRRGGRATSFENRYVCKDGSYRWFLWNAAPDTDAPVIYSVARDITASKRAEEERAELVRELEQTLSEVRTLQTILPICSYCKKIRDDQDYWLTVESYISRHTASRFSHGICPTCMATEVEPQLEGY